jgi:hypothetical protein
MEMSAWKDAALLKGLTYDDNSWKVIRGMHENVSSALGLLGVVDKDDAAEVCVTITAMLHLSLKQKLEEGPGGRPKCFGTQIRL